MVKIFGGEIWTLKTFDKWYDVITRVGSISKNQNIPCSLPLAQSMKSCWTADVKCDHVKVCGKTERDEAWLAYFDGASGARSLAFTSPALLIVA